jgi:ribosomal protein S18 acetylase RimI-like enzyme
MAACLLNLENIKLQERIEKNESVIFIAVSDEKICVFTQLYPSFTSVGIDKIWVLNDIYVNPEYRKVGIAQSLIEKILAYSEASERGKVVLSTSYYNLNAQKLYEKLGFTKTEFYTYVKYISST